MTLNPNTTDRDRAAPTVCAVQYDIAWEDRATNLATIQRLLAEAPPAPGGLVALPELCSTGYSMNVDATAEDHDRPTERLAADLAVRYGCWVIAGVATRGADGRGCNEAVVLDPAGNQAVRYAKMRPMSVSGEADHYTAGQRVVTFQWAGLTVCPLICYDLRFPELFRRGVELGAELFVVIANWPAVRHAHWRALLTARAIENQAAVLGVNRIGADGNGLDHAGGSVLIDHHGVMAADAQGAAGVMRGVIDPAALRKWRADFPALRDIRPIEDT